MYVFPPFYKSCYHVWPASTPYLPIWGIFLKEGTCSLGKTFIYDHFCDESFIPLKATLSSPFYIIKVI